MQFRHIALSHYYVQEVTNYDSMQYVSTYTTRIQRTVLLNHL